jgi:hypothetical protein
MAYVDTATLAAAPRVAGDLHGRIEVALLRRATTRIPTVVDNDDQREMGVIRTVIDGNIPAAWVTLALSLLDVAGLLTAPTDAQIDAEVVTAWNRIIKSRG